MQSEVRSPMFPMFLIKILKEKSSHKHQDPAKSWKNKISIAF